jgi:hypothetical protein
METLIVLAPVSVDVEELPPQPVNKIPELINASAESVFFIGCFI